MKDWLSLVNITPESLELRSAIVLLSADQYCTPSRARELALVLTKQALVNFLTERMQKEVTW